MFRGLIGIVVILGIAWLFSTRKKQVNWKMIGFGILLQLLFAVLVLKVEVVMKGFESVSRFFVNVLGFSSKGAEFLFGSLVVDQTNLGYIFAFQVLPTILFFSALSSLLYHWGILQLLVKSIASAMRKLLKLSGPESLSVAGNIFLGQTESPLLIKPYLPKMSNSELLCVMVGGMATIAGGVLAAYIGLLGGTDEARRIEFAKHLIAASVMAAPAAVVMAKILFPETEQNLEKSSKITGINYENWLDAIAKGTRQGISLAVNVGAMLLVFIALMALFNWMLYSGPGEWFGLNASVAEWTDGRHDKFSMQFIMGYLFAPMAWLIGIPNPDIAYAGQLMGEKLILNEFVAYTSFSELLHQGSFEFTRSETMITYVLCGFANFSSIGIQVGGIGVLAPNRQGDLAKLGMRALLGGTLASMLTATLVGLIIAF